MQWFATAMPAYDPEDIDEAYRLAYWLHPDDTGLVAVQIVRDAAGTVVTMAWTQARLRRRRRPTSHRSPLRRLFPEEVFQRVALQIAVLEQSEERVHKAAQGPPGRGPQCGLTPDDWLVHYVKWLCWQSLLCTWHYTTLALGRYLYTFDPPELDAVAPLSLINARLQGNFSRNCRSIKQAITQRFTLQGDFDNPTDKRRLNARECTLAKETLERCTPWYPALHRLRPHLRDLVPLDITLQPGQHGLATLFKLGQQALTPEMLDWLATCLLLSPELGMAQLIHAMPGNSQQGNDPMYVPSRPDPSRNTPHTSSSGENPPPQDRDPEGSAPPGDRAAPPPLDERHLELLKDRLEHEQQRLLRYTGNLLCVRTAGEEYRFQAPETAGDFRVPVQAPWLRVYGEDSQGELLLAVIPLELTDEPQTLRVDAGYRRIMCMIEPVEGGEDETTVTVRLTCMPVPWWVRLGRTVWLVPSRVAHLLDHLRRWRRWGFAPSWMGGPQPSYMTDAFQRRIRDIAHDLVTQLAPDERPFFEAISTAFFANPRRLLRGHPRHPEVLGAGLGGGDTYWTPVVLAVATAVLARVQEQGEALQLPQQRAQLHDLALALARRLQLPETEAQRLAEALGHRLAAETQNEGG